MNHTSSKTYVRYALSDAQTARARFKGVMGHPRLNDMKYWITALAILLLVTNGFWMYRTLDNGITLTYSDASLDLSNQMYRQSLALSNLNLVGATVEEAKALVGKDIHGLDLFEKEGCLYAGQICMQISTDRTIEVIREPNP